MSDKNSYNGIVNVYKDAGFTSFDVVAKLRGIFGMRKIGHTGTLDPEATGVLPICLGNATKCVELLMDHDKEYIATLQLGIRTDTQDTTGEVLETKSTEGITEEDVRSAIMSFVGDIMQVPPMYSALKVNGQKLCDLARKGVEVERKARPVTIHDIEIVSIDLPEARFRVHCSKGTYIRTLCDDIGVKLGCGGAMKNLERARVGIFDKASALKLSELQDLKDTGRLAEAVSPVDGLFPDYPKLTVAGDGIKKLENGNKLSINDYVNQNAVNTHGCVRVYRADGSFAGIYKREKSGDLFAPEKMFL